MKPYLIYSLTLSLAIFSCSKTAEPVPDVVVVAPSPPVIAKFEFPKPADCGFDLPASSTTDWKLIFEDDFSKDLNKWSAWKTGAYNNELQLYKEENLIVKDGHLFIHAKKAFASGTANPSDNSQKGFEYTSGRIESRETFGATKTSPVRIIARIQLPKGVGMWPAFWTYADPWPTKGEIDILEARGHETNKFQSVYHFGNSNGLLTNANINNFYYTGEKDLATCFFVYELLWEDGRLSIKLDDKVIHSFEDPKNRYIENFLDKKHRIIFNLAVGGDFIQNLDKSKIVENGVMMVDWIRVYSK
jgi:beta-glucanase (GH16 family)